MSGSSPYKPKLSNFRISKIPLYSGSALRYLRRQYYKYGPFALLQKFRIWIFNDHKGAWELGKNHELSYWKKALDFDFNEWPAGELEFRIDPESELQGELAELIPSNLASSPRILDVGCGPLTSLGKNLKGKPIEMICIDPLADEYAAITNGTAFDPLVKPKNIPGEEIFKHFDADTFDLAHAQNCLDHAYAPDQIIQQMLWSVKPGGYVYLYHLINEADRNEHKGLHQWNFYTENGSFVIADSKIALNLSQILGDFAEINCSHGETKSLPWLIVKMKKTSSFDI